MEKITELFCIGYSVKEVFHAFLVVTYIGTTAIHEKGVSTSLPSYMDDFSGEPNSPDWWGKVFYRKSKKVNVLCNS